MINTELYEQLCINKDKPEMHCHGKCHLSDEMNSEKGKKSTPILDINLKDYPIGSVRFVELGQVFFKEAKHIISPSKDYQFSLEFDIFHPPKRLV
jgi:hypothetical protein